MGKMALRFVFCRKKAVSIVNSLSCDMKEGKIMGASVIYTHLHDIEFLLKLFFWEETYLKRTTVNTGEMNSLIKTSVASRMQKLKLLVNFSMNTPYKQPTLSVLDFLS